MKLTYGEIVIESEDCDEFDMEYNMYITTNYYGQPVFFDDMISIFNECNNPWD
jgi:hypothetical protein